MLHFTDASKMTISVQKTDRSPAKKNFLAGERLKKKIKN